MFLLYALLYGAALQFFAYILRKQQKETAEWIRSINNTRQIPFSNPCRKFCPPPSFLIVRKKLLAGRNVCFRVTGNSMFPLFRAGRDSVCIRPCSSVTIEKPKRGDIILFCISGKYILHRVMRIEGNRVVTAGDGNRGFDAFASPQNPLRLIPLSKQSEQPNDSSRLNDSDESERTGELLGIAEARIRGGHKLDFNSPAYRIPAALWRLLFPLRPALLRLFGSAARLRHRFFKEQNRK